MSTAELCTMLLPDSGHLQEEEARYAQHQGASIHIPPLPLYTAEGAVRSLKYFRTHEFDQPFDVGRGVRVTLLPAGHILGAAQIHLSVDESSIHFTGDLGRSDDPLKYPAPGGGAKLTCWSPNPLAATSFILQARPSTARRISSTVSPSGAAWS